MQNITFQGSRRGSWQPQGTENISFLMHEALLLISTCTAKNVCPKPEMKLKFFFPQV